MIYHEKFSYIIMALKKEYAFKHQSREKKNKYLVEHGVDRNLIE